MQQDGKGDNFMFKATRSMITRNPNNSLNVNKIKAKKNFIWKLNKKVFRTEQFNKMKQCHQLTNVSSFLTFSSCAKSYADFS